MLGFELAVDEKVVERTPPYRKAWETVGSPKLLVIGGYRMGFDVAAQGSGSLLRWCTERMVSDAVRHFTTHKERE